jgi:hypothetical protein
MSEEVPFAVPFSTTSFVIRVLQSHKKVSDFKRTRDVVFDIIRVPALSEVRAVLTDIYTIGLAQLLDAIKKVPGVNCVISGGDWSGYTVEAKDYALQNQIGLFTTSEFFGALWWKTFHDYHKKDEEGYPIYHYKSA